jgi:hypothetical protein
MQAKDDDKYYVYQVGFIGSTHISLVGMHYRANIMGDGSFSGSCRHPPDDTCASRCAGVTMISSVEQSIFAPF